MQRSISALFILMTLLVSLSSFGCVTSKAVTRAELRAIRSADAVRYPTPAMYEDTVGRDLAGFLLLGGLGSIIASELGRKDAPRDFGDLVLQSITQRVAKEVQDWPIMSIVEQPVDENYAPTKPTLFVRTNEIVLSDTLGFHEATTIELAGREREKIWRKLVQYNSRKYDRMRTLDEFKADDNKLLKEEMRFAADKMVYAFIEDLRASK
jgi:hypothetical protein